MKEELPFPALLRVRADNCCPRKHDSASPQTTTCLQNTLMTSNVCFPRGISFFNDNFSILGAYQLLTCAFFTGEGQCNRSRRRSELRLRLQQCYPAPGRGGRSVRAAGRGQSPRGKHQQIQHFLRLPHLP